MIIVSSGNAAQAAALFARLLGVPCTVVVADFAAETKLNAAAALGATIVRAGTTPEQVFGAAEELADKHGLARLHPFDHADVIAGQGSLTLEILEEVPSVGTIVVPTGGGGLLASVALVVKALALRVRVIGVEPAASPVMRKSVEAGRPVKLDDVGRSVADGLLGPWPGKLTFPIVRDCVDDIVLVDDDAILEAMALAYRALRVALESSAVVSLAALLAHRWPGGTEVTITTGGNFDPALLAHVTSGGKATDWGSGAVALSARSSADAKGR